MSIRLRVSALVLIVCLSGPARGNSIVDELKNALAARDVNRVQLLEAALTSSKQPEDTLLAAGALLAENDLLREAAAIFARCAEEYPSSFEAKYNLALAQIELADFGNATKTLDSISPVATPHTAAVDYLRAKVEAATGNPGQALKDFEKANRADPANENYALDLALLEIRSYAYVPAIAVLRPTLAAHPGSEELNLELALSLALSGQRNAAVEVCHKLMKEHPELTLPHVIAAFSECVDADYHACEAEAAAGLRLPNASPYLFYLQSEALWNLGSSDRTLMLQNLDMAVTRMPECTACLLLRSRVREAVGNTNGALADARSAITHDPQFASAWYRSALLYRKLGYEKEAADALIQYRALRDRERNEEQKSFERQFVGSASALAAIEEK
ncbi:MAG: hypothetical protein JOY62_12690 [Acidobacteriaceae bacterium]|nr:hypothetical protein [Acidobacteriaceae bacterium]MBV9780817.1 hypothetical protein [Acidobacteriaceae bacterium]